MAEADTYVMVKLWRNMHAKNYWTNVKNSSAKRFTNVLHEKGTYENICEVYLMKGTYMQPHMHEYKDQVEKIELLEGEIKINYFDSEGTVKEILRVSKPGTVVSVSTRRYHTYRIISESAMTKESMNGIYDPKTWKTYDEWAPAEDSKEASQYLSELKLKQ